MSRLLGLSGIKSLEQFKSLSGSSSGAANKRIISNASFASSESVSSGSFANLKLAAGCNDLSKYFFHFSANVTGTMRILTNCILCCLSSEKLVREQASAKSDLELAVS